MLSLVSSYKELTEKITTACERAGRTPSELTLIAVTKYVTMEQTREVFDLGIKDLGENRVNVALNKIPFLEAATWHFIGPLQSRKVKDIVNDIDYFHALDRLKVAKEMNKRLNKTLDCFIQVNVSGETSKGGIAPDQLFDFIDALKPFEHIRVVGLMTMAPHIDDQDKIRAVFRQLRELRDKVMACRFNHAPCQFLSMGMSQDFTLAILEGATHLRIGSLLVNPEG